MSKTAAKTKAQEAEEAQAARYAAGAAALQKAVAAACGEAKKAGLTDHQLAGELRTIAQRLSDGKGAA